MITYNDKADTELILTLLKKFQSPLEYQQNAKRFTDRQWVQVADLLTEWQLGNLVLTPAQNDFLSLLSELLARLQQGHKTIGYRVTDS
ncbi:hypothetical protein CYR83_04205 [Ligilactobacillus agilis]|uniref:Uncharacterized protein n=1 Tax=Ligilactobacillus agilis TaxID=1601 RepID=A0A2I2ACI5_9LACO|nr:hypothetical protein [Ligilactobacillus agilis]PLA77079.1 hypothetical protein CYR79_02805 [Ligilactobacillus agilis]PLA83315.1 hypothetical protein CYR83_04205 [Ligilactobacillus agilis]